MRTINRHTFIEISSASGLLVLFVLVGSFFVPWHPDEALWSHIGHMWLSGKLVLYQDTIENKGPGIFLLFGALRTLIGEGNLHARIVAIFVTICWAGIMSCIVKKLYPASSEGVSFSIAILGMLVANPYGNLMTDLVAVTFIALAVVSQLSLRRPGVINALIQGLIGGLWIGVAASFKQNAILYLPLPLLVSVLVNNPSKISDLCFRGVALVLGLVAASGAMLMPVLLSGATVAECIDGIWGILLHPGTGVHALGYGYFIDRWIFAFENRNGYLQAITAALLIPLFFSKLDKRTLTLVLIWWVLDAATYAMPGTFHPAHAIYLAPSLALAMGLFVPMTQTRIPRLTGREVWFRRVAIGCVILAIALLAWYPLPEYRRIRHWAQGEKAIGCWLKDNTDCDERILVLTDSPYIIWGYAERRTVGKSASQVFFTDAQKDAIWYKAVKDRPPQYIVKPRPDVKALVARPLILPMLDKWISENCVIQEAMGDYHIFKPTQHRLDQALIFQQWDSIEVAPS